MKKVFLAVVVALMVSACGAGSLERRLVDFQDPKVTVVAAAVILSELGADRVVRQEPEDASVTLARLDRLKGAMNLYLTFEDSPWANTARHEARRSLYIAMEDIVGSRIGSLVNINGQLDIGLSTVLNGVDRAGKAAALREDILAMKAKVANGEMSENDMLHMMVARFGYNVARINQIRQVL